MGDVEREHPPGAEGVAVAEPAGDHRELDGAKRAGLFDQLVDECDRRVGPGEPQRERRIRVAVGAWSGEDQGFGQLTSPSPWNAARSRSTAIVRDARDVERPGPSVTTPIRRPPPASADHRVGVGLGDLDHESSGGLGEQRGRDLVVRAARRSWRRARPAMHISAMATARPPSLTSWHDWTRPRRIAWCRPR